MMGGRLCRPSDFIYIGLCMLGKFGLKIKLAAQLSYKHKL